ncbi:hypothetical protein Dimus_014484, partial [Dionaea muscipula]
MLGVDPREKGRCFDHISPIERPLLNIENGDGYDRNPHFKNQNMGLAQDALVSYVDNQGDGWRYGGESYWDRFSGGELEVVIGPVRHNKATMEFVSSKERDAGTETEQSFCNALDFLTKYHSLPFLKRSRTAAEKKGNRSTYTSNYNLKIAEDNRLSARQFCLLKSKRKRRPGSKCFVK